MVKRFATREPKAATSDSVRVGKVSEVLIRGGEEEAAPSDGQCRGEQERGGHAGGSSDQPQHERGLETTKPILAVLDGAKALAAAIKEVFDHPVITRCQIHKLRT